MLVKNNIGVLGMKSIGESYILSSNTVSAIECLHYAMNLPTSGVITGIDSMRILDQAFEAVRTFKPMDQARVIALLARTREAAAKGQYERYKTTNQNDSTAMNPAYLRQRFRPCLTVSFSTQRCLRRATPVKFCRCNLRSS